jgi:hypothetical protein
MKVIQRTSVGRGDSSVRHITTTSGHVRALHRSDRDEAKIQLVAHRLELGLTQRIDSIPDLPGHCALMAAEGPDLLVTVFLDRSEGPIPLLTFGVATQTSPNVERLWRIVGGTGAPPAIPWCATKEEPYAAGHHVTLPLIAEYERLVAWAWIDKICGQSGYS